MSGLLEEPEDVLRCWRRAAALRPYELAFLDACGALEYLNPQKGEMLQNRPLQAPLLDHATATGDRAEDSHDDSNSRAFVILDQTIGIVDRGSDDRRVSRSLFDVEQPPRLLFIRTGKLNRHPRMIAPYTGSAKICR